MSIRSDYNSPDLAFLFDLDGVLIHSTPLHNRAWEIYLERQGVSSEGIQDKMHGLRNDQIVRGLFGDALSEPEVLEHGAAKERVWRELMGPVLGEWLVPGVGEFLARYRGVPSAVASNAEIPNIDFVLDGAGLRPYFQAVVDGNQVERPKPHPDIYLRAASLLRVPPERCVVFEDSHAGIQAARGSGARVVGLRTTLPDLPDVDLAIDNFSSPELEVWLKQIRRHG